MAGRKEPGCTPLRQAPEEFIRCNDDTASRVGVPSENCTRRTPQNTKFFKGASPPSDSANPNLRHLIALAPDEENLRSFLKKTGILCRLQMKRKGKE